jgi:basic membrane protein A
MISRRAWACALFLAVPGAPGRAAEFKPAIVYDLGGKFDKSFNEGAFRAIERFKSQTGVVSREFEIQNDAQREQAFRRFARDGQTPIVAVGFSHATALEKVAKDFPNTQFAIVDTVVNQSNVESIVFREQEGSYVVGILAAMASKTGKIGFVGGMDIPLIRRFACGYVQGARDANARIEVLENMTGTTGAAWSDPVKGGELARAQVARGADVILQAAGGTGLGVLRAAAEAGVLGIGTDANQNGLHPGKVLTSMLKRVDSAVLRTYAASRDGTWKGGVTSLGLAEEGIGWALDEHNNSLITPAMKDAADRAVAGIISGQIKVHDFTADGKCPFPLSPGG